MKWLFTRDTLAIFRRLKNAFDPENLCNPDKLIPLISRAADAASAAPVEVVVEKDGTVLPKDEAQLIAYVKSFAARKKLYGVQGMRTKIRVRESAVVRMANLNNIVEVDRNNLTVTAQGGASLAEVRAACEKEGRYLWVAGEGTVGGVIASRSSAVPPLRDQILGMRVLFPTGEIGVFGAKTMKNVAGYDVPKLLIGSWGTLGIILEVTFRLLPFPPPSMQADRGRPFILKDLHKRVRKALNPDGLLSPQTAAFTEGDIAAVMKEKIEPWKPDTSSGNIGDGFWIQ
jgi:FAD/FMN-containing dehydrogenase